MTKAWSGMRHPSWKTLSDLFSEFAAKYGGSIYDREAGRSWDPGQFACRLAYGPDWQNDVRFKRDDQLPDSEPVPGNTIALLQDVIANGLPEWTQDTKDDTWE